MEPLLKFDDDGNINEVRTSKGKYTVWPSLRLVDFVPKGRRRAAYTLHVNYLKGTEPTQEDVYKTIIRMMAVCESS